MRPESDAPTSSPDPDAAGADTSAADGAVLDRAVERDAVALARVRSIAEPLCVAQGVELVEVAWSTERGGRVLRVIIDRPLDEAPSTVDEAQSAVDEPQSTASPPSSSEAAAFTEAVTLEDCVRVSRDLSAALDAEEIIAQAYSLEVSSPGLDRPLRTERDFRRQRGRLAKIKLHEPAPDGQRVLRGTILEADSEGLRMEVDGNLHCVPFDNITEARLVFELGAQPKKGGRQRKPRKR